MTDTNHYFVDHLNGESYNIVDAGGSVLLTLRRSSHTQATAVRDAMEYAYVEGSTKAGSSQDGYEHGYSVGYREGSETVHEEAYAEGRREYHWELWNRADSWPEEITGGV